MSEGKKKGRFRVPGFNRHGLLCARARPGAATALLAVLFLVGAGILDGVDELDGKKFIIIWCPGGDSRPYSCPKTMAKNDKERCYFIRKSSNTGIRPEDGEQSGLGDARLGAEAREAVPERMEAVE